MRLKSYSKINLTLRVLKKLKSGLHDIETHSTLIDLYDEIDIKKNKKDIIIFQGKFKNKVNPKKNSIIDTLNLLRKFKIINNFYKITIKKNIPVYSGLGGGTSNSFCIARHFLKNNFSKKLLIAHEKKIGSDFRLFLNNNSFQKNLTRVFKIKNNIKSYVLLVYPNINCKTKNIFKIVRNFSSKSNTNYFKKFKRNKYVEIIKKDRNDLQQIVEKKYSKISNLLKFIGTLEGCIFSRMTGSGSVCYGVFNSKKTAKYAMANLKRKYLNYWCVITKTI